MKGKKFNIKDFFKKTPNLIFVLVFSVLSLSSLVLLVRAESIAGNYCYYGSKTDTICQKISIKTLNRGYYITYDNDFYQTEYRKYPITWKIKPYDNLDVNGLKVIDIRWTDDKKIPRQLLLKIEDHFVSFYEDNQSPVYQEARRFVNE